MTQVEANSNTVVSSMEKILLAIENIYDKCKNKKEWTQHEVDKKDFDKFDSKKKPYTRRIAEAKQQIKNINNYIEDYKTILEDYHAEKKKHK